MTQAVVMPKGEGQGPPNRSNALSTNHDGKNICFPFNNGNCKRGDECGMSHVRQTCLAGDHGWRKCSKAKVKA